MPFDHGDAYKQEQNSETECQFVLLANIALRRLLNRAYRSMCSPSKPYRMPLIDRLHVFLLIHVTTDWMGSAMNGSANPSTIVHHELALQLDNWFRHLPPSIAAQMSTNNERNWQRYPRNLLGLLRGRYWAAKFVVYRPYVYKALSSPPETLTAEDFLNLQECLEAGLQVPQEVGLLTETARLIVSPFAPIRRSVSPFSSMCL